ncbi:MAG TPA: DUF4159 domain-containing protein [Gammaproteobacteria bacterium]|nr:DUF4159 domain-containing protein [Gammaproteobacteria bacterium]
MRPASTARALIVAAALLVAHTAQAQRAFREYPGFEGADSAAPLPDDWQVPAELVIGRLMYPSARGGFLGGGDWRRGGTGWTDDYPKGDRLLVQMLRRLTRANVRAVEQPVNPDDGDDIDYWPFMIVGLAGSWQLTDAQAANIREYLLRGGFMFCDSFFGDRYGGGVDRSWASFEESLKRVFPDRPIIDLTDDHPIFHTVFDLPGMTKVMIPHVSMVVRGGRGGLGYGLVPHWRGVADDKGRLMMLIAFNNDNGDAWQWADDPRYPGELVNLSLRLAVNVAMYSMTH